MLCPMNPAPLRGAWVNRVTTIYLFEIASPALLIKVRGRNDDEVMFVIAILK